ncbi:Ribonuclease II/R [Gracilaria domingensis]|nr:Ribonuclease II/R [Gracilaria domingensis]
MRILLTTGKEGKRVAIFSNENREETYLHRSHTGEAEQLYNKRLIVAAVKWLNQHWRPLGMKAVILTDSSAKQYASEGVPSITLREICEKHSDLLEIYAEHNDVLDPMETEPNNDSHATRNKSKRPRAIYPDYLPERTAKAGIRAKRYYQGTYHPSVYDVTEATVTVCLDPKDKSKRTQVLIVGRENQNRSIDGDVVIIELLPKSEWQFPSNLAIDQDEADVESDSEDAEVSAPESHPRKQRSVVQGREPRPTGRVVAIAQRNWRPYCGTISEKSLRGGDTALCVPMDRNVPKIRVRSRRIPQLLGKRVLIIIDKWDRTSIHPSGHIVREIGPSEDKEAETEVILIENGIPTRKFSDAAMACLPNESWKVTEEHCKTRWDLREVTICSVDPPGCTDIDDALHFRRIDTNEVEVGVHIADVTAFVGHGTVLDNEAAERGCTVYLVDRRIEMLPGLLSGNFCSLRGGEERLAFSVLIRMDNEGNIKQRQFGRSVIKSKAALTYEMAQNRIDDARKKKAKGVATTDAVTQSLLGLAEIAKKLRERRMVAGALILASPEVKFKIEEAQDEITDVAMYEVRETNRMVEEFMLLANIVVAEKMLKHFPQCSMLRRHPKPSEEMFEPLIRASKCAGFDIDVSNSKRLNESLAEVESIAKARGDGYLGTLLRIVATRSMTQAVYFSSGEVSDPEYLHYGLAAPVYTHFTSPIRRYADVLVHRLLSACLGYASLPVSLQDSHRMNQYAEAINQRHRCAQYASRASTLLHTVLLFKKEGDKLEETARIIRILGNGLVVLVPRYGVEGIVHISDDEKEKVDDTGSMMLLKDGRKLQVLGEVQVRIRIDSAPERMDKVVYELI